MDTGRWIIEMGGSYYWERANTFAWATSQWTTFQSKEAAESLAFNLCVADPTLVGRVMVMRESEIAGLFSGEAV
jgi:hypothetical protein